MRKPSASSFGMELTPVGITDAGEIERGAPHSFRIVTFTVVRLAACAGITCTADKRGD